LIALSALLFLRPGEPSYQGNLLSTWLAELSNGSSEDRKAAEVAIREIGTNALPILLQELRASDDSPVKMKLWELAERQKFIKIHVTLVSDRWERALNGFEALGATAKPAVPELVAMLGAPDTAARAAMALMNIGSESVPPLMDALTSSNLLMRAWAAEALGILHTDAKPAIPRLLKCLGDPIPLVRSAAAKTLGYIGEEPDLVVPALVICLEDTNRFVKVAAIGALGSFGKDAKRVVPLLLKLVESKERARLSDYGSSVGSEAVNALKRINPEAAAQVNH